ncbi:MAG TPA: prenyltransferase/squalene oxidase repeat-containing protein [Verrucomicrobiae bacterium]
MNVYFGSKRLRVPAGHGSFPLFAAAWLFAASLNAAEQAPSSLKLQVTPNVSLRNEVKRAITKGLEWLVRSQSKDGFWSSPDYPAMTGLGLCAFRLDPEARGQGAEADAVRKGYTFLLSCVQSNGGIYRKELPSYNTSIALTALVLANRPEYTPAILNARKFVASLQVDLGQPGKLDSPFDGGIGYGSGDKQPDLSNTSFALEAMAVSKNYVKDRNLTDEADLNWQAAIHFIQSCQNLPAYNREPWVSDDPTNRGGFIYAPGRSMAGETNFASGRVALRSYGSMSYAGLLSYIYADLKRDDPRVIAVVDWLKANFTVEENPALGAQGLFYYYQMMAKALSVYGADAIELPNGTSVRWREQLALKLINLQRADGSWANDNGRWFEKDPALVTAYSVIALDLIYGKL